MPTMGIVHSFLTSATTPYPERWWQSKKRKMESIKKWFESFKAENEDKKDLTSRIQENLTEYGFNETKFNASIEKNIKSIEKQIIQEKFESQSDENKEDNH